MPTASRVLLFILAFILLTIPLANAQSALQFVPITPCRVVDTRNTGNPIIGGTSQNFAIQGSQGACNGIPPSAAAYSFNVAVVPQGALGYLTVWPAGETQPVVATLNSLDGRVKSNAAVVGAGSIDGGAVSVFASNTTDVILDLDGYFTAPVASTLGFYPITPCRVLDTRSGQYLVGGQQYTYPVSGLCNIPSGATAYSLNFTAVPHQPLGYLTAWPTGQTQPLAATLNAPTGTITANASLLEAGTSGDIDVFASNDTDLVIDANGYFALSGFAPGGLSLFTETPCRVLDTRPNGQFSGTLPVEMIVSACGLTSLAQAVVVNATVVPPGPLGYLSLWANGQLQPVVATLNAIDGEVTSNMAVVPMSNGFIDSFASNPTQLVVDLFNYFAIPSGLNGNYTFTIDGYNMPNSGFPLPCSSGGNLLIAGSFTADGNGHVGGVLDLNCSGGNPVSGPGVRFIGTYSIQPNGLGTMTIMPSPAGSPPFQFSLAISSTGGGRLILNNESNSYVPNSWGTGAIMVQDPAALSFAQIAGNFASGFSGVDPSLNRYAGAGAYQITQTQNVSGNEDINDNGTLSSVQTSGMLLNLDPNTGRGQATLVTSGILTHWIYYVSSANELTFLSIDPITSPTNLVLQTMLRQTKSTFDDSSLNGVGVVRSSGLGGADKKKRRLQSSGTSGATDVVLGLFTGDGAGNGSVSLDENNGGTLTQNVSSGTYSVASNGRVTLAGFGNGTPPLFYLAGKNQAFVLGQDTSVAFGFLAPQSGAPFSNQTAIGTYWGGNFMPVTQDVTNSVTWAFADGNGNLNGTNNFSGPNGTTSGDFTATYSVDASGRMTLTESGNVVAILYVISPTRVALLPTLDPDPSVTVLGSTN